MIKLKNLIIILLISIISTSLHANSGVDCSTSDARCRAYDLEVNVEVLQPITFIQHRSLNLGEVTKGEVVSVDESVTTGTSQERGKTFGILEAIIPSATDGIVVSCIKDSSYVNFGNLGENTIFDSCEIEVMEASGSGGLYNENDDSVTISGYDTVYDKWAIHVGGEISVPQNSTNGTKSGVVRIEVVIL